MIPATTTSKYSFIPAVFARGGIVGDFVALGGVDVTLGDVLGVGVGCDVVLGVVVGVGVAVLVGVSVG